MAKTLDKILNAQTTTLGIKLVDGGSLQCVLVPRKQISVYHFWTSYPKDIGKIHGQAYQCGEDQATFGAPTRR